jgi:hypothetical protein
MSKHNYLLNILHFFLVKIIIGIIVVGGSFALAGELLNFIFNKTGITGDLKNTIISITQCLIALLSYVILFRFYEKRQIKALQ